MACRGTPHESTGFGLNLLVYSRKLFMAIDIMVGRPKCSENVDELNYVQELRRRLEHVYGITREHLELSNVDGHAAFAMILKLKFISTSIKVLGQTDQRENVFDDLTTVSKRA